MPKTSPHKRRTASEEGLGLCSSYLEKLVGRDLAYLIVVWDMVDGRAGNGFVTDLDPNHVPSALRRLADAVESGELVDAKSRHH